MSKGIEHIIAELSSQVSELKKGNLTQKDLIDLTELSRELYEMLVVMRYQKAKGQTTNSAEDIETPTVTIEPEPIIQKPEPVVSEPEENILFDFSREEEVEETEQLSFAPEPEITIEATTPEIEPTVIEAPISEPKNVQAQASVNEQMEVSNQADSINNAFEDAFSNSVAKKLELQPIRNLAGHISLNQRFIFIANLFENNAETYNAQIATLDQLENENEAKSLLSELHQKFNWDLEDTNVTEFVTLVERRFL